MALGSRMAPRRLTALLARSQTPQGVLEAYAGHESGPVDSIVLSTVWSRLRKLMHRWPLRERRAFLAEHADVVQGVATRTLERLPQLEGRALANVAHASSGLTPELGRQMLPAIAPFAADQMVKLTAQGVCNMLWAYASPPPQEDVQAPGWSQAAAHAEHAAPSDAADAMPDAAQQPHPAQQPTAALCGPREVRLVFDAAADLLTAERLAMYELHDISSVAWSFASVGVHAPTLLSRLAGAADAQKCARARPRHLSVLAWALAHTGTADAAAFERIGGALVGGVASLSDRELSTAAWAFAHVHACAPRLLAAMSAEVERRARARVIEPQAVAITLWGLASCGHTPRLPYETAAAAAAAELHRFGDRELATLMWALARAGQGCASKLVLAMDSGLSAEELGRFSPRHLCTLTWALCVLGEVGRAPALMERLVRAANALPLASLSEKDRACLHQASLTLRYEYPDIRLQLRADLGAGRAMHAEPGEGAHARAHEPPEPLLPSLSMPAALGAVLPTPTQPRRAETAVRPQQRRAARTRRAAEHVSNMHADVSAALSELGIAHVNRLALPGLGYCIDIALADTNVAVEVAGPHHYTKTGVDGSHRQLLTATQMKCRHLQAAGWRVVLLPHFEIEQCTAARAGGPRHRGASGRSETLQRYLRAKIASCVQGALGPEANEVLPRGRQRTTAAVTPPTDAAVSGRGSAVASSSGGQSADETTTASTKSY